MGDESVQGWPSGTVTFLFSDIEKSTAGSEKYGNAMIAAIRRHHQLLETALEEFSDCEYNYDWVGDAIQAAFDTADGAIASAVAAQRLLAAENWGPVEQVKVRMALHTGTAFPQQGKPSARYVDRCLARAHRLMSVAHGGQVLVSSVTAGLVRDALPRGVTLRDLGRYRLKDLLIPEHIYQLDIKGLERVFPPLRAFKVPNNLPIQLTPLIDREQEMGELRRLILEEDVRLINLTGIGGMGKTRLALQLAAEVSDRFEDGVFIVRLSSVRAPGRVTTAIARTLGVRDAGDQPLEKTLMEYLQYRSLLLILDCFEHLVHVGPLIKRLLTKCPQLCVIVTSTRTLKSVGGRREYPLPALDVPQKSITPDIGELLNVASVSMFTQRVQEFKPSFQVDRRNASSIADICNRLQGVPLAIELAAARVRVWRPEDLLDRLRPMLPILTGGPDDGEFKHKTMSGTIACSYGPLTDREKTTFRRIAIFQGGCTVDAATAVCFPEGDMTARDAEELIETLADWHLVRPEEGSARPLRFSMFETIREYGLEKLREHGEVESIRKAHAICFMNLAEEAEPEIIGPHQRDWLARLEDEQDNLREALRWAHEQHDIDIGLRLAAALGMFWYRRGYLADGRYWLESILGLPDRKTDKPTLALRAKAVYYLAYLARAQADFTVATSKGEECLELATRIGDTSRAAYAQILLATVIAKSRTNPKQAEELYEQGMAVFKELGDEWGQAVATNNLAALATYVGELERAEQQFEVARNKWRTIGDNVAAATAINNLGSLASTRGALQRAEELHKESLTLTRELGDRQGSAFSLFSLGMLEWGQGKYSIATQYFDEAYELYDSVGDKWYASIVRMHLGDVVANQKDFVRAEELYDEALSTSRRLNNPQGIAQALLRLGRLALDKNMPEDAVLLIQESITHYPRGDQLNLCECLEALAEVACAMGNTKLAVLFGGAAAHSRDQMDLHMPPVEQERHERLDAALTAQMGRERFEAEWAAAMQSPLDTVIETSLRQW